MSTLKTALMGVGYKPIKTRKPTLAKIIHRLFVPLTCDRRRIVVQSAGSHFKARYEGCADFVFGDCKESALDRLKSGRLGS